MRCLHSRQGLPCLFCYSCSCYPTTFLQTNHKMV
jgi:hypothetical protein